MLSYTSKAEFIAIIISSKIPFFCGFSMIFPMKLAASEQQVSSK
jgi:hypothetical protein